MFDKNSKRSTPKTESKNMGKKGANKKAPNHTSGSQASITLREESSGKKQPNVNGKSMLKLEHLQNLAVWASNEASIPSLGAFFGHQLAALGESLGSSPNPSLFPCQRCESILQPGYNCTVRIEKNTAKARRRCKSSNISTQNSVVYKCHFYSHRNLKRGTHRGHMKDICPPKAKPSFKLEPSCSMVIKSVKLEEGAAGNKEVKKVDKIASPAITTDDPVIDSPAPAMPYVRTGPTLLEAKRRKRNRSGAKKAVESESNSATTVEENSFSAANKRKRKSWTSLKEIVESSEHEDMKRAGSSWKQLGVVKINHIFREGNGCVDRLANGGLTRPVGIVVFVVMPACIVNILASDSQGLAKGCKGTKVREWGISPMVPTRQGCPYLAAIPQWPFLQNFCKIAKC